MIIDFDNPKSFPQSLHNWSKDFESYIKAHIPVKNINDSWEIEHQLRDLSLEEHPIVTDFLKSNLDTDIIVCHCTRILNESDFLEKGLINSDQENRINEVLEHIGLTKEQIHEIFKYIYFYLNRDMNSRSNSIHFFVDKNYAYRDDRISNYAINVGGEIVRWAIEAAGEAVGRDLYKEEPYKRLWIIGRPCIVRFKCKLSDIDEIDRNSLVTEIVKYNIVTKLYGYSSYDFNIAGRTIGNIPASNIISIEEIEDFHNIHGKYEDADFYRELK